MTINIYTALIIMPLLLRVTSLAYFYVIFLIGVFIGHACTKYGMWLEHHVADLTIHYA